MTKKTYKRQTATLMMHQKLDLETMQKRLNAVADLYGGYVAFLTDTLIARGFITQAEAIIGFNRVRADLFPSKGGQSADMWVAELPAKVVANIGVPDEQ